MNLLVAAPPTIASDAATPDANAASLHPLFAQAAPAVAGILTGRPLLAGLHIVGEMRTGKAFSRDLWVSDAARQSPHDTPQIDGQVNARSSPHRFDRACVSPYVPSHGRCNCIRPRAAGRYPRQSTARADRGNLPLSHHRYITFVPSNRIT